MKLIFCQCKLLLLVVYLLLSCGLSQAQVNEFQNVEYIIQKIEILESNKDPKCYATANRLEDFMYGTPLDDAARNFRIDVQKEINLAIRQAGSNAARNMEADSIELSHIKEFVESFALYGELKNGDLFYQVDTGFIIIPRIDFEQYSSVAYSYRAMLSVEQDLFFLGQPGLLPFTNRAIDAVNYFLNLNTLAALKLADAEARTLQSKIITSTILKNSWLKLFRKKPPLFQNKPAPRLTSDKASPDENLARKIVQQKLASYEQYNQLNASIFLRNIQVFFARQKWPTGQEDSNALKNYFLESLVVFASELIQQSGEVAAQRNDFLIRVQDIQQTLQSFMPFSVNQFEDVTYFPFHKNGKIQIESYDLDAFRDSGIHWRILSYALDDLSGKSILHVDPHAAELVVEGIAQLGVLVLRLAGEHSHQQANPVLTQKDIEQAFIQIQTLIDTPAEEQTVLQNEIVSVKNNATSQTGIFQDVTSELNINFEHKSSDWLNRLIRSYVFSKEEHTIKMAIPPAFGGGGVAAEDINNDNLTDILLLGGFGNQIYLNQGNGRFKNITAAVPINKWSEELDSFGEPRQPIIADFDNDGWQDILITYVNDRHLVLKNTNGTSFEDVSAVCNLDGHGMVAGPATVLDYDNDGLLDIFIGYFGNYIKGVLPTLSRDNINGMPNKLYRNLGGFQFQEVEFTKDTASNFGWTQAVGHADINQDNRQDIIVGNDFGLNKYYLNTEDGFVEQSKLLRTDKPSYTMNIGIGDVNRDLFPDFYISNIVVMQKEEKYVQPNAETTMKFNPEKMTNIRTVEANDLFLSSTANELEGKLGQ